VRGYLAGLGRALAGRGRAAVVLAPGGVERAALSGEAAPTTVLLAGGEALPDAAAAGRVYVLPTGLLPRAVFTALLAACDLPPLLAGDGATSSAIALGRPFVLAPLDWNITNLRALRARLASLAPPGTDLVDVLFRASCYRENPSFVRLDELLAPSWEPVFLGLRAAIPCVAEHLLATVGALRTVTAPCGDPRWLAGFPDARLRRAILAARALEGDRRAWRILADELRAPDPVSPAALRVGLDLLRRAGPAPGASGLSDSLRAHLRALLQTPLDSPPVRRAVVDAALALMPRDRTARAFVTAELDAALRGREPVVPPALRDLVDAALRAARVPWEGRVGLWIHLTRRVHVTAPPPDPRDPRTARALRAIVRALEVPATTPPPDSEHLPPAAVARACAALLQGASPSSSAR
jgi:hypothetical protein